MEKLLRTLRLLLELKLLMLKAYHKKVVLLQLQVLLKPLMELLDLTFKQTALEMLLPIQILLLELKLLLPKLHPNKEVVLLQAAVLQIHPVQLILMYKAMELEMPTLILWFLRLFRIL